MGHYWSEMRSGIDVEWTCHKCGEKRIVDRDERPSHSEWQCIQYLRKRIEALEKKLGVME